jgi:hypothetical protein
MECSVFGYLEIMRKKVQPQMDADSRRFTQIHADGREEWKRVGIGEVSEVMLPPFPARHPSSLSVSIPFIYC